MNTKEKVMGITMDSLFDLVAKELEGVKFASDDAEMETYDLLAANLILHAALMSHIPLKEYDLRQGAMN